MQKSYKFRIYPGQTTEKKVQWVLDRCRELYNACLTERRDAYNFHVSQHPNYYDEPTRKQLTRELTVGYYEQQNDLPEIKQLREEYQEIGSHVLQNVVKRIELAFQAFFRRVRAGETPGYPRFKSRERYNSFCYPDQAGWKLKGNRLTLAKIGEIKVKLHRQIEGNIKTCTIKRAGTHWYAVFATEVDLIPRLAYSDEMVGIDLGTLRMATLSTGDTIENPRYYRCAEHKLKVKQQAIKHKKPRSKRRKKAGRHIGKLHRKVANQRKDFLHKQARALVDTYDTLVLEDLSPSNLSRRPKPKQDEEGTFLPNGASAKAGLNKSIRDAGWAMFQQMCTYKAAEAGRYMLFVNPQYTSQVCSGCGQIRKKELSERWHSCDCGTELDRDENAARNILRLGRSLRETRS